MIEMGYLDKNGLSYFWEKIKSAFLTTSGGFVSNDPFTLSAYNEDIQSEAYLAIGPSPYCQLTYHDDHYSENGSHVTVHYRGVTIDHYTPSGLITLELTDEGLVLNAPDVDTVFQYDPIDNQLLYYGSQIVNDRVLDEKLGDISSILDSINGEVV